MGESEDFGYVIDSVWPSQEAALGQCKKLYKESVARSEQYGLARFSLNLERWVVGVETAYCEMPCWEIAYNAGKHGSRVEEKNVVISERHRYGRNEEVRVDGYGKRLAVWVSDKDECFRVLTSLLE